MIPAQGELELGLEPVAPRTALIAPVDPGLFEARRRLCERGALGTVR